MARRSYPIQSEARVTVDALRAARALLGSLGVAHTDLTVADSSAIEQPPTQEQFASVLAKGLDGVSPESLRCMIAIIADTGIDAWQAPARDAMAQHLAAAH